MHWTFGTYEVVLTLLSFISGALYVNHRTLKIEPVIAVLIGSVMFSVTLSIFGGPELNGYMSIARENLQFSTVLLHYTLGLFLFVGAIHINLPDLLDKKVEIGLFATFSVVISSVIISASIYFLIHFLPVQYNMSFLHCLIVGTLISPTDPVAVLSIRHIGPNRTYNVKIT